MTENLLQIDCLSKSFGNFQAVRDLSFGVAGGEIVGLLGPNGAGKTTTLRCVAGILQPNAGRITIAGHDLSRRPEDAKRCLSFVPEVPNPYDMLTVMEHLRFVAAAFRAEDQLVNAEALLRRLDLWEKRNTLGGALSKGMKQKLACACALIHPSRVVCFDEPLIGIDPRGQRELKDMIMERRNAGDAVLVSTHMLDTAERLCDRVIIMNHGTVIAEGTMEQLTQQVRPGAGATLEDMFLQLTEEATFLPGPS